MIVDTNSMQKLNDPDYINVCLILLAFHFSDYLSTFCNKNVQ